MPNSSVKSKSKQQDNIKKSCFLVLGMHRSGTSALTRVLNLAGAKLPADLMPAATGNSAGHWESNRLVEHHDTLLSKLDSSWLDWRALNLNDKCRDVPQEIANILKAEYGDASQIVVKDPRICRFAPLFIEALEKANYDVHVVIPIRNPMEVCKSLEKRDGMLRTDSALLWLRHILDAEAATRKQKRAILTYEDLLTDWRKTLDGLTKHASFRLPCDIDDIAPLISDSLRPDLRHHTQATEDLQLDPLLRDWVAQAWQAMLVLTDDPTSKTAFQQLDDIRHAFDAAAPTLHKFLADTHNTSTNEINRLNDLIDSKSSKISQLEATLQTANTEKNEADSKITELEAENKSKVENSHRLATRTAAVALASRHHLSTTTLLKWPLFLRPRSLKTNTLLPVQHIQPNGQAHGWEVTGSDPQLLVPAQTSARYIRIRFVADILGDKDKNTNWIWQLFFDYGDDYSENNAVAAHATGQSIEVDIVAKLSGPVVGFRLDPTNKPCQFILKDFQIIELSEPVTRLSSAALRVHQAKKNGLLIKQLKIVVRAISSGQGYSTLQRILRGPEQQANDYESWIARRAVTPELREKFERKAKKFTHTPVFFIIMPTYNSPAAYLKRAVNSVLEQTYPHWELCIVDDGSKNASEIETVLKNCASGDDRIKIKFLKENQGIAGASNVALEDATGDYIALMDHDDELQPHALHAFADAINKDPSADWLYSDEDKIDIHGKRFGPFFKPDWSPAYFSTCMYTCHLGVYRTKLVKKVGGFRPEFNMAQDYDLALRIADHAKSIVHIADILYHWRTLPGSTASGADAKPIAETRAREAVQESVDRNAYSGKVVAGPFTGAHRVKFDIKGDPLISIAIPSAGYQTDVQGQKTWFVLELVRSIREKTSYQNIEIVIADNNDFDQELIKLLEPLDIVRVHYLDETFNMADKMNLVVEATRGEYVVLLNDDMTIINDDWLTEMLMWAQQDDVCGVGAKLFFPDGRIQHAGVLVLEQGPSHPYYLHQGSEVGLVGNAVLPHEVSAVTGACMMLRREDYLAVDGFDPFFRVNYNDVDFCLRLRQHTGKRIVWTPYTQLYHYESVSRETPPPKELNDFKTRWPNIVGADPFFNKNLSQVSNCYEIDFHVKKLEVEYELDK